MHTLLHSLGSLKHGEHWDLLASDGVGHEASEDRELVKHIQHEQVQENVYCFVSSIYLQKATPCRHLDQLVFFSWSGNDSIICLQVFAPF